MATVQSPTAPSTAAYYVELNTGSFEIPHINDGTNAKKMNLKQGDNFNSSADQYTVHYLYEKERQEFKDWISTWNLKEQLSRKERITYHYKRIWTRCWKHHKIRKDKLSLFL